MSTTTTSAQPPSSWYPNLTGLNLPRALISAVNQAFTLIYSLRDTATQGQDATNKLVQYGKGAQRTQTNAQSMPDGALWFETDTGDIYQSRFNANSTSRTWVLVAHGVAA